MERSLRTSLPLLLALSLGCDDKSTPAPAVASKEPVDSKLGQAASAGDDAKTGEPNADPSPPKDGEPKPAATNRELVLPGADIELPAKPTFPKTTVPARHPDRAWSIHGLREELDNNVADGNAGVEVVLRASVQEIYVAPTCPDPDTCPPAKQPHVWVVDDAADKGKRRAMLVVNYAFTIPEWDAKRWESQPEIVLEVGKEYLFKGIFKQFSDTGFASDKGLLEFRAVETTLADGTKEWIFPPGAYWHPIEIQRQEEATAALAEAAKKSAAGGGR